MDSKTARIRALNDELRQNFAGGAAVMTPGIAALAPKRLPGSSRRSASATIPRHANDPHQEDDSGVFDADGQRVFSRSTTPTRASPTTPRSRDAMDHGTIAQNGKIEANEADRSSSTFLVAGQLGRTTRRDGSLRMVGGTRSDPTLGSRMHSKCHNQNPCDEDNELFFGGELWRQKRCQHIRVSRIWICSIKILVARRSRLSPSRGRGRVGAGGAIS